MTVEQDLAAFRDLALETQTAINALPEDEEPDQTEIMNVLDPELAAIVGGHYIELEGSLLVPVYDYDTGVVTGDEVTTSPQRGFNNGVLLRRIVEEVLPGTEITRWQVGYSLVLTGQFFARSVVHETSTTLRVFGPVECSSLSVPELDQTETGLYLPDVDDERAHAIDEATCNGTILLGDLQSAFDGNNELSSLSDAPELLIRYYENYLSSIFSLTNLSFAVSSTTLLVENPDGSIEPTEHNQKVKHFTSEGSLFLGFRYLPQTGQLCFVVDGGLDKREFYIAFDDIVQLSLNTLSRMHH